MEDAPVSLISPVWDHFSVPGGYENVTDERTRQKQRVNTQQTLAVHLATGFLSMFEQEKDASSPLSRAKTWRQVTRSKPG